jgi:Calcineurin-like phosphoesterase
MREGIADAVAVRRGRHLRSLLLIVPLLVAAFAPARPVTAAEDPVLVGAGDIGDCTTSADEATAKLLDGIPGTVIGVGDIAYPNGTAANFRDCYAPNWGRHKARTRPAVGNHEYKTPGAVAYFDYFGSAAGPRGKGWYSYNVGAWHVVVLNSNCAEIGGCGPTSAQVAWLKSDLAANAGRHVLAYFHHPRYSSGEHGNSVDVVTFWEVLYAAGAELVLNGHDHDYERFAPQDPWGRVDPTFGIRQFVVGTGGRATEGRSWNAPNSEVFATTHGVLKLTLRTDGYDWAFLPVAGKSFTDSGAGTTHGAPPARTRTAFTATGDSWVDQANPSRNYGASETLVVDGDTGAGKDAYAYIKVKVANTTGTIDRVGLRLWVTNASRDGPTVAPTTCGWTPSAITWLNRPAPTGPAVFDMRGVAAGRWTELDVTPLVRANGLYCFVLRPTSSDGLDVSSNQGTHPPRLVVDTLPAS